MSDDRKRTVCDCCRYKTQCGWYKAPQHRLVEDPNAGFWFCDLCMRSMADRSVSYYPQYREQAFTVATMMFATNAILDTLAGKDWRKEQER